MRRTQLIARTLVCAVVPALLGGCTGQAQSVATAVTSPAAPSVAATATPAPATSVAPSASASAATSVPLDATIYDAGFLIHLTGASLDPDGSKISVTGDFTNQGLAASTLDTLSLNGRVAVDWQDTTASLLPTGPTDVPAGGTLTATLSGPAKPGLALDDATLVFGTDQQHQSRVPFAAGQPVETQLPRDVPISGATDVGKLLHIQLTKATVVPAICDGSAGSFVLGAADKGQESILVTATLTSKKNPYGTNADTRAQTPSGPSQELDLGSVYVPPKGTVKDVVVCYTVPAPASGHYVSHWEAIEDPLKPKVKGNIPFDVPAP